jgi:mono/diheme cytochrome c family protein
MRAPDRSNLAPEEKNVKRQLVSLLTTLCLAPAFAGAAERVGDFALLDHNGYFHHMAWYDDHKAIAFLVQANGSATTKQSIAAFREMHTQYDSQGVEFMMLNPLGETRAAVSQEVVLIDDAQLISEAMGIDKAGEVFLFDPSSFRVVYRGPADQPFADALAEIAAGKAVTNAVVAAQGTPVTYPARDKNMHAGVSYSKEIAPILAENCASCHRDGGIAPFAMDSHAMAQGWSPMIREVLMTKRMPPGQIDPHVGNFRNNYVLSTDDQQVRQKMGRPTRWQTLPGRRTNGPSVNPI